jgi:hypothetical protein
MEGHVDGGASNFDALSTAWAEYQRCLNVHSLMEDVDMFPLIDEVNGSPTRLEELHARDMIDVEAVDSALAKIRNDHNGVESAEGAWGDVALSWKTWQANHLDHFKKEEDVMMPLVRGRDLALRNERVWYTRGSSLLRFTAMPASSFTTLGGVSLCCAGMDPRSSHRRWQLEFLSAHCTQRVRQLSGPSFCPWFRPVARRKFGPVLLACIT